MVLRASLQCSSNAGESSTNVGGGANQENIVLQPNAKSILRHKDLCPIIAEYDDPQSRFYARIALRHKLGWIPKDVLEYGKEKREKGERLKWNGKKLWKVVEEDNFEVVKWAGTFNEYVKENLCEKAARYGKLHMLNGQENSNLHFHGICGFATMLSIMDIMIH